jgi:hypothetical protein
MGHCHGEAWSQKKICTPGVDRDLTVLCHRAAWRQAKVRAVSCPWRREQFRFRSKIIMPLESHAEKRLVVQRMFTGASEELRNIPHRLAADRER